MFYTEKERLTPINDNYDVIVVGSGPAGVSAAIAAGRAGVKVLLLEMLGSVGGISTSGLMSHWTGRCGNKIYQEILNRSEAKAVYHTDWRETIDTELLRNIYYEMLSDAGVDILLYTIVCDVIMDGNKIVGVIGQSKSGRVAYMAKVIIDASGDGDVAYRAGAAYTLGRDGDHKMQPATLMFKVGGVDMSRAVFPPSFETTVETPKGELQALAREKLPKPAGHVLLYRTNFPGIVTCNMTNVTDIDGTKAEDLTRAELVCRSQMEPIVNFLREYAPGYEHCYILTAASQIGVRETRHFHGVYTLTNRKSTKQNSLTMLSCMTHGSILTSTTLTAPDLTLMAVKSISSKTSVTQFPTAAWCPRRWMVSCFPAVTFPVRMWHIPVSALCRFVPVSAKRTASRQLLRSKPARKSEMYRRKIFKDTFNSQKQPSTAAFFHKNTKDAEPVASYVFLSII